MRISTATLIQNSQCWHLWLTLCLVATALVNWFFFQGFIGSDDNRYFMAAYRLLAGQTLVDATSIINDGGSPRIGLVGLVAFLLFLTGKKTLLVTAIFTGFHLLLVLQAAWLGRRFYNDVIGLFAAVLMAFCPMAYYLSGVVLPNLPVVVLSNLAFMCLLRDWQNSEPHNRINRLWAAAAGMIIALSASFSVIGLIMTIPAIVIIIWRQRGVGPAGHLMAQLYFFVGFFIVVAFFYLCMLLITGHFISELDLILTWTGGTFPHGRWPWERVAVLYKRVSPVMPISIWLYLVLPFVYCLISERKWLLMFCFLWPILYITFGSVRPTYYMPPPIDPRHYLLAAVPGTVMASWVIWKVSSWVSANLLSRHRLATVIMAAVLLMGWGVGEIFSNRELARNFEQRKLVNSFLEAYYQACNLHPELPVVLSSQLSDRMSGLFLWCKRPDIYINNKKFAGFHDGLPKAPFLFVSNGMPSNKIIDYIVHPLGPEQVSNMKLLRTVKPAQGFVYQIWQGQLYKRFNSNSMFVPRYADRPVDIFLVN